MAGPDRRQGDGERFVPIPELDAQVRDQIASVAETTFADRIDFAPAGASDMVRKSVQRFFGVYPERAVRVNKGGLQFEDSLWLYVVTRCFAPPLIVESGVFQGHTTWILRQACPDAAICSFDIDLSNVIYRDPDGDLFARDWMDEPVRANDPVRSLAFFDDHVNQALRVRQAYDRGFRFLLFDDNVPAWNLAATGMPPLPTLAMILDPNLKPGADLRWWRHGRQCRYVYREEDTFGARALIDRSIALPDLPGFSLHSRGTGLTLVKLVD